jgi:hypothetical protein
MTCSDYRLLIPFRHSGDLLTEDVALLTKHLESCPACAELAKPSLADSAIRNAFHSVSVPAGLKDRVGKAVAAERMSRAFHRVAQYGLALSILLVVGLIGLGIYGRTKPRLDTEGLAIRDGYEGDPNYVEKLVYVWLDGQNLTTDLPFEIDFKYYAGHGYEKMGRAYVPFIRFQNQSAPAASFAKLYFIRGSEVDVRHATDAQSSFCTARVVPGPNGITFILVHTGDNSAPFIRLATNNGA